MDDKQIKNAKSGKIITRSLCNNENDIEVNVTYDTGMAKEYRNQLGYERVWVQSGMVIFKTEKDMLDCAAYFAPDGGLSKARPATPAQVRYMIALNISIPENCTVEQASRLIDAAKSGTLGSIMGAFYTDGSN